MKYALMAVLSVLFMRANLHAITTKTTVVGNEGLQHYVDGKVRLKGYNLEGVAEQLELMGVTTPIKQTGKLIATKRYDARYPNEAEYFVNLFKKGEAVSFGTIQDAVAERLFKEMEQKYLNEHGGVKRVRKPKRGNTI